MAKDKKPRWKKITSGKLYPFPRQRNRRVKPLEVIEATQEELAYVSQHFELVQNGTGKYKVSKEKQAVVEPEPEAPEKDTYTVETAGSGWFNVLSASGTVMNEKKLRAADAATLKTKLEEEQVQA